MQYLQDDPEAAFLAKHVRNAIQFCLPHINLTLADLQVPQAYS